MRKPYIDNLRWMGVLLLFPYHAAMVYNNFGESFYVWVAGRVAPSLLIHFCHPWHMPLLFVLAGVSSRYALARRSAREYLTERFRRLLIPLVAGILLLVPVQTYYAERWHNGYTGGYLKQIARFFSAGDMSGYRGGFTPAHLWFMFYLLVISLVALPLALCFRRSGRTLCAQNLSCAALIPLFLIPYVFSRLLILGGKSLGEYLAYFLLGYFLLSQEEVVCKLVRARFWLACGWLGTSLLYLALTLTGCMQGAIFDLSLRLDGWMGILALLGFGARRLNFTNAAFSYFSRASFPVYILHQGVLVACAFYAATYIPSPPIQYGLIVFVSFGVTLGLYEVFKRFPLTRFLLGIKPQDVSGQATLRC